MREKELQSNLLLLTAAVIWGFAFVAQRVGAKYLGSFAFNGVRFALGGISLIPLLLFSSRKPVEQDGPGLNLKSALPAGLIAGVILFLAVSLQQIGLVETSAGKAAFITGLYLVIVPFLGIFLKHQLHISTWLGVALATTGLYFLSVTEHFTIAQGDLLELIGAFLWAVHILVIDHFIKKIDGLKLSFVQFLTCSVLSLITALIFEKISVDSLRLAIIPILYGGICSVGIAYTLQVIGQKYAHPSHAAIILSMESVFASIGGLIILNEILGFREYLGCALMLLGMLLSQAQQFPLFGKNR